MHASSVAAGLRGAGRYLNNKYKRGFHPLMAGWCEIEEGGAGRGGVRRHVVAHRVQKKERKSLLGRRGGGGDHSHLEV